MNTDTGTITGHNMRLCLFTSTSLLIGTRTLVLLVVVGTSTSTCTLVLLVLVGSSTSTLVLFLVYRKVASSQWV